MTGFGMYGGQTDRMMNIEVARILLAEREREIETELRHRRLVRLLRSPEPTETQPRFAPSAASAQRRASSSATSR